MIASPKQCTAMLRAMRGVADPKRQPMTAAQYKAAIAAVGLYQEAAGAFFGWSPRRSQAWAAGAAPVPWPVQWCLEFMVANDIRAVDVEANS